MKPSFFLACILCHTTLVYGKLNQSNTYPEGNCRNWTQPFNVGHLPRKIINQSSGIATSAINTNRLIHVNYAGDGPFIHLTKLTGEFEKTVKIKDFAPVDVEDLGYGTCGDKNCIVIGDVGDTYLNRDFLELIFIEDQKVFPDSIVPLGRVRFQYPDSKHDAEGIAMHPNGDIYIITKDVDYKKHVVRDAKLFVIKKEQWQNYPTKILTATEVAQIDLNFVLFEDGFWGRMVTGIDISPDGKALLVMTYENAVEFFVDLSQETLKPITQLRQNKDYKIVTLIKLPQQEAIAYMRMPQRILVYTSAYHGSKVPIMALTCRNYMNETLQHELNKTR